MYLNKIVLITGGNGGLGRNLAVSYAKQGAKIINLSRNTEKMEILNEQLNNINNQENLYYKTDVSYLSIILSILPTIMLFYGLSFITQKQSGLLDSFSSIKGIELQHNVKTKVI